MTPEKPTKGGRYVRDAATGKIGPAPETGATAPAPVPAPKTEPGPAKKKGD